MASQLRVNKLENRSGLGTITYTDSGPIVSGIVTANSFSGDIIGDITGAVTATTGSFSGDVSIAEKIIHTGDTNTFMKFDTDTVIFETAGDTRLRITSTGQVNIGGDYAQTDSRVTIIDATKLIQEATLNLQSSATSGAADTGAVLRFYGHSGTEGRYHSSIKGAKENGTSGNYSGYLSFNTRPNGSAMQERLRIESSGAMRLKSEYLRFQAGDHQVSDFSQKVGLKWTYETDIEIAKIEVSRPSWSGGPSDMLFHTCNTSGTVSERLRIDSGGSVSIGDAATHTFSAHSEGDDLVIGGAGWRGMTIYGEGGGGVIQFADNASNRVGQIVYYHAENSLDFRVNGNSTRLKITSDGHTLFSGLTDHNDSVRNVRGITIKSTGGVSFQNYGSNGSRNWRIRPDDMSRWGDLDVSVSPTANSATDWPDAAGDRVLTFGYDKNVTLPNGNLVVSNGHGIDFSANTNDATGLSDETLDDYEEGLYIPSIVGSSGGSWTTATYRHMAYTKIGRLVHIQGYLQCDSESSPSGSLRIQLPFTVGSLSGDAENGAITVSMRGHGNTSTMYNVCGAVSSNYLEIISVAGNGTHNWVDQSDVGTSWNIRIGGCYTAT